MKRESEKYIGGSFFSVPLCTMNFQKVVQGILNYNFKFTFTMISHNTTVLLKITLDDQLTNSQTFMKEKF